MPASTELSRVCDGVVEGQWSQVPDMEVPEVVLKKEAEDAERKERQERKEREPRGIISKVVAG